MSEALAVELVVDAENVVGECPLWESAAGRVVWVDIPKGEVHRYSPLTGHHERGVVGDVAAAIALRRGGGYVVAREKDVVLVDDSLAAVSTLATFDLAPGERFNDGACDPTGRFWVGTAAPKTSPRTGALYRITATGDATVAREGVALSNGLGWSPDGSILYYVDSMSRRIDRFAFDGQSGAIAPLAPLVEFEEDDGVPDGLCVDVQGGVWIALWGGWAVRRYLGDGTLAAVVELPVAQVTSCAFGGRDVKELYITSARSELDDAALSRQPLAGALFRCRAEVAGLPSTPFQTP